MGIEDRLKALKTKHTALHAQIQLMQCSPGVSAAELAVLKKKKLTLKDDISRLENPARMTAPKQQRKKKGTSTAKTNSSVPTDEEPEPDSGLSAQLLSGDGAAVDLAA